MVSLGVGIRPCKECAISDQLLFIPSLFDLIEVVRLIFVNMPVASLFFCVSFVVGLLVIHVWSLQRCMLNRYLQAYTYLQAKHNIHLHMYVKF